MADAGWAALGGIAFGVIGKGALDYWLAMGKTKADREARAEARRDKRLERRDDLQRQTLLDLQDTMLDVMRTAAQGLHADVMAEKNGGNWGKQLWPDGLAEKNRVAHARLNLLTSRLRDDRLRALAIDLSETCTKMGSAKSRAAAEDGNVAATHTIISAQALAGKLIREMDDIP